MAMPIKERIKRYISNIDYQTIGSFEPIVIIEEITQSISKVKLIFTLKQDVAQDDWRMEITPAFHPEFHWSPHLTPTDEHIIDQHSFRAPALLAADGNHLLALIPDLDIMMRGTPVRWYMDLNAAENKLTLGMSEYEVREHVLYVRKPGACYPEGTIEVGFYIMAFDDSETISNPWRPVLAFQWQRWGSRLYKERLPFKVSMEKYVEHAYHWAFEGWGKSVWQEFDLDGRKVGAPIFIVDVTQSPNYQGQKNEREFRSIWNQAWFSSMRSAQGIFRFSQDKNNAFLMKKALLAKELALSAPKIQGFFPSVIATEMEELELNGEKVFHSKGWNTHFWGNSNRNPIARDAGIAPYHILDMSWTALLMLTWYEELEKDERLLGYALEYADALIRLQDEKGFFPAWLDHQSLRPLGILDDSPETSMSVTFLLKSYGLTKDEKYLAPALKAMEAVIKEILPSGRWEDFETYWSCSRYGEQDLVGKKVKRNNMHKQCNFSMFWTAEALFHCYDSTGKSEYLAKGQRCLDELLMTQASWQPPYVYVDVMGGFGVMNCDGEWNDARQSLFAELIIQYGIKLDKQEYIQRGLAALRASFHMMYCPENHKVQALWQKTWPFFNEKDYGFMMENYGHEGVSTPEGDGMGCFTIFDWGNGAAAESYLRILHHFGKDFIKNN